MIYTFHSTNSHLEMQLNDIIIVSVMISDAYTIPIQYHQKWPVPISGIGASLVRIIVMLWYHIDLCIDKIKRWHYDKTTLWDSSLHEQSLIINI